VPSSAQKRGLAPVFSGKPEDALVYAPAAATAVGAPLFVLLHGAGGNTSRILNAFTQLADSTGMIVVAPKSVGATWDSMTGAIGPDVENIDRVLNEVTRQYRIDPTRLSIGGFSDGASYALALGRLNGTLFRNIVAFSPGILLPVTSRGTPGIFISHGTADAILSIDRASRAFVPELKRQGFSVDYHEFEGPHTIPPEIARLGVKWMLEN
jgi:phospholipase/carboxylesterase